MSVKDDDRQGPTPTSPPGRGDSAADDPGSGFNTLLDVYGPVLRAGSADVEAAALVAGGPQDDVALAGALAERIFTEESVPGHFPPEALELLGSPKQWVWCLRYIRCCWAFGWLVCRGCRDYRALNYYLYRYWLCVRRALGQGEPDRREFEQLAKLFRDTYGRWLRGELAQVELEHGGSDDLAAGRVDCCRDDAFSAALFDRLATSEAAMALIGRDAFVQASRHPYFWLCRCWCQAALRLGCCMACARTREELEECYREYRERLRWCVRPLHCELTGPTGCVAEEPILDIKSLGVAVTGSAGGAFFGGYTIEWRIVEGEECADPTAWKSTGVHYPGGGAFGSVPVTGGTLGWIDTLYLPARSYEVRVCLRSLRTNDQPPCCCIVYNLFKRFVRITAVGAAQVGPDGPYDADAPLVYQVPPAKSPHLVPVGCCLSVKGSAWVGECNDRKIRCFTLKYAPGFLPGPMDPAFNPAVYATSLMSPVCYEPPDEDEKRAQDGQLTAPNSFLTTRWVHETEDLSAWFGLPPGSVVKKFWRLREFCWNSTSLPACLDKDHGCASGQYTLLLDVEDTQGDHYYDTQQVWFDNKTLHVAFGGLRGLEPCQEMSLRRFVGKRPCTTEWPLEVLGTVYDEYIIPSDHSYPSDNFDFYTLSITKGCGGPTYQVPITPDLVHFYRDIVTGDENWAHGTAHIGLPASTAMCPCPPQGPHAAQHGVLTLLDLRIFDAVCAAELEPPFAPPPGFALKRGECCGYTLQLYARDKTVDDSGPGRCHEKLAPPCAVCICNDLDEGYADGGPPQDPGDAPALRPQPQAAGPTG